MSKFEKPRTLEQNRRLWQAANELGLDEEIIGDMVYAETENRTRSSKEMTEKECEALIKQLSNKLNTSKKAMRGKIIHLLCTLPDNPMVDTKGAADFERINAFIKEIGSNNPKKKILNYLYYQELVNVVTQVESMYNKQMKS
ncbi:hypothetical protein QNI19_14650 [Cytophagaceae bacterium DM2B3-1]|uniref:DUF1018 domain-containing protein n=1 Tax=Xanthocytophaga flava TaxID=3048013 RepID=A0ABT7CMF8_9BACT|nr:hypothetical protein [Xanthocytophaga flavus]MDJ1494180.1 hypothetical protein [Xanthocytophaga flavus]